MFESFFPELVPVLMCIFIKSEVIYSEENGNLAAVQLWINNVQTIKCHRDVSGLRIKQEGEGKQRSVSSLDRDLNGGIPTLNMCTRQKLSPQVGRFLAEQLNSKLQNF